MSVIFILMAHGATCELRWITFQMELFARKTLCNIVLDLCTLHTQTQTDIACILFSPGGISVSEMKQTANISCLLHCRYYTVSTGADTWIIVRCKKKKKKIHTATILSSLMDISHITQILNFVIRTVNYVEQHQILTLLFSDSNLYWALTSDGGGRNQSRQDKDCKAPSQYTKQLSGAPDP